MGSTLDKLEERVSKTVERLNALVGERERLENELAALRERLDGLSERDGDGSGLHDGSWHAQAGRIAGELRRAVEQLRER